MSKDTPFAREEVMEEYLSSLLRDVEDPADVTARTAKLLEQATVDLTPDIAVAPEAETVPQAHPAEVEVEAPAAEVIAEVNASIEQKAEVPQIGRAHV